MKRFAFPTGIVPQDSDAYVHMIERSLSDEERRLWVRAREQVRERFIEQAEACGLGRLGVERLAMHWASWPVEAVMVKMEDFPPTVRAWLFQALKSKPDPEQMVEFICAFMETKDPIIAETIAYALCSQPTATNAADTLAHFSSASTLALVEEAFGSIDPQVAKLIHRLVHQEIFPHLGGDTYYSWGWSYYEEEKYGEAIKAYSTAIAKRVKGDNLRYSYIFRARCRLLHGDKLREIVADIKSAIAVGMPRGEAYRWIGNALTKAGIRNKRDDLLEQAMRSFQKARKCFQKARKCDSDELFTARSDALVHLKRYVEADEDYIRLARLQQGLDPGSDSNPWELWWKGVIQDATSDSYRG